MARLPNVGSDSGAWGGILNEYLGVELRGNGALKIRTDGTLADIMHTTGSESVSGTKTFNDSPVVPAPTLGNQVANKSYVDAAVTTGGFRGVWDNTVTYNNGDIVTRNYSSYGALASNTGQVPIVATPFLGTTPATADSGDAGTYEMGIYFTVSKALHMTAINFYKGGLSNGGTHVGRLWNASTPGSAFVLSSGTFANETASGVQALPLTYELQPGTTYCVSVSMPTGHYSVNNSYYNLPVTVGSVTVPANGSHFSNSLGVFPDQGAGVTNYWVFFTWDEPNTNWSIIGRF